MNFRVLLWLSCFFFAGLCFAQDFVQSVSIQNEAGQSTSLVDVSMLLVKPNQSFKSEDVKRDVYELYLSGYFHEVRSRVDREKEGVSVTYVVAENPKISALKFEGATVFSPAELQKQVEISPHTIYNHVKLESAIKNLQTLYSENGYLLSELQSVQLMPDQSLQFVIQEGRVHEVKIEGNAGVPDFVIRRSLLTRPKTVFNQKQAAIDQRLLYQMGYFSEVEPLTFDRRKDGQFDVTYRVHEKKFNLVNLGLEYERLELLGFVSGALNHVLIPSDSILGKVQIGKEGSSIVPKSYDFRYVQPWFLNWIPVAFSFDGWIELNSVIVYDNVSGRREGWKLGYSLPWWDSFTQTLDYQDEHLIPDNLSDYRVRFVGTGFQYRSLANQQDNQAGEYASLNFNHGSLTVKGQPAVNFDHLKGSGSIFFTPATRHVLAARLQGGLYLSHPDSTANYSVSHFQLGGNDSIRGYPERAFSGSRYLVANLEYRWQFNDTFQFAAFTDIGNVGSSFRDLFDGLKVGKGVGVRIMTPIGPVRTDFGWGDGAFGFYLNIGQTF